MTATEAPLVRTEAGAILGIDWEQIVKEDEA